MADTKISALTTVTPANLATSDWVPIARGSSSNGKVDLSKIGTFKRLTGLDPTGTADANDHATTGLIIAQLLVLSSAGGGVAFLDPGSYKISKGIDVPSNVILRGAGKGITNIVPLSSATAGNNSATWVSMAGVSNSGVEHLTIDLSGVTGGGDGIAFAPPDATAPALPNMVTVTGTFTIGELVSQATSLATGRVWFNPSGNLCLYDVVGTFNTANVVTGSQSGATGTPSVAIANVTTNNCYAYNCEVIGRPFTVQYGIWVRHATNIRVDSCTVRGGSITESGSTEFAFNSSAVDQCGINVSSAHNATIVNNTVETCASAGIVVPQPSALSATASNVLIANNFIRGCSAGVSLYSNYLSSTPMQLRDVVVANNRIINSWRYGIRIGNETDGAVEVMSGVIVNDNIIDNRGSKMAAAYGNYVLWIGIGATAISAGCKVVNNVFMGGGGGNAGTLNIKGAGYLTTAHKWELIGNTFDANAHTSTQASLYLITSNDVSVCNNRFTRPGVRSLVIDVSLRSNIRNNYFYGHGSITDTWLVEYKNTSSNGTFANNTLDSVSSGAAATIIGDSTGVGMEFFGNVFVGSTLGTYAAGGFYPWATEATTTQTHGFGTYSPANGGANFTITNRKVSPSSLVVVRQTAGTALAFTVSQADGTFVLTPSAVFAGTSTYQYQIIN